MRIQLSAVAMASAFALSEATHELVKDIYPGETSSSPIGLTLFDGKAYFAATGEDTGVEIYVSDGQTEGTKMLKDINPGSGGSNPSAFAEFDDKLFFRADDGTNGAELWVTDGTEAGTQLFLDINDGAESSNPHDFVVIGNKMVFVATTPDEGEELWVTDGTVSGTKLLEDIQEGPNGSSLHLRPEYLIGDDTLVFPADDGQNGQSLFSTDGTRTTFLKDVSIGDTLETLSIARPKDSVVDEVFFAVGSELWVTDGTTSGTTLVQDGVEVGGPSRISSYTLGGNTLFFGRKTGESGDNLWETRGTSSSTRIIASGLESPETEVSRGASSVYGLGFGPEINGKMALITDNGIGTNLWVTDGSDIEPLVESTFDWVLDVKLSENGDQALFYIKNGTALELWASDYTSKNTQLLTSFPDGVTSSAGYSLTLDDKIALFTVATAEYGVELWKIEYPEIDSAPSRSPTRRPTRSPTRAPTIDTAAAPMASLGLVAMLVSAASALLL